MKRTLSLLSALAFVLAFSGSAFAQTNVTASTDIVQDLNITKDNDLNFGQISNSQSNDAIIDPNGTNSNTGNTVAVGKISIGAANGSSLDVSFSSPANLTDGSTNNIGFTPNYTGNDTDDAGTSSDLNAGATNTVTANGTNGEYYLYLGGTLAGIDINGAPTGNYTGTISVTISYN